MTVVDIQFSSAHSTWAELREGAIAAEEQGFRAVWVFDHLAGVSLGGTSMLESCALLGALAQATTTIELGTMVANVWNREPGILLAAAATVTELSGNRQIHLGLGAGTSPTSSFAAEQRAVGAPIAAALAERHARVSTTIELARRMWAGDRTEEFATFARPDPRPSLLVGVNSVSLAEIAGRWADGINVAWRHPRRDGLLASADRVAGDRPFVRTVYTMWDPALLDPDHPERVAMRNRAIDRLVLAQLHPPRISAGTDLTPSKT